MYNSSLTAGICGRRGAGGRALASLARCWPCWPGFACDRTVTATNTDQTAVTSKLSGVDCAPAQGPACRPPAGRWDGASQWRVRAMDPTTHKQCNTRPHTTVGKSSGGCLTRQRHAQPEQTDSGCQPELPRPWRNSSPARSHLAIRSSLGLRGTACLGLAAGQRLAA